MDKYQALFIRACKSNSTESRLKRLYKMFYYGDFDYRHCMYILTKIVQEHSLVRLDKFLLEYNDPDKAWKYGSSSEAPYCERMTKALSSIIRLSEVSKFQDYPVPAKFRNKD